MKTPQKPIVQAQTVPIATTLNRTSSDSSPFFRFMPVFADIRRDEEQGLGYTNPPPVRTERDRKTDRATCPRENENGC